MRRASSRHLRREICAGAQVFPRRLKNDWAGHCSSQASQAERKRRYKRGRKNAGEARNSDGVAVRAQTWHTITAFDQKNYPRLRSPPFWNILLDLHLCLSRKNEKIELSMFLESVNIF